MRSEGELANRVTALIAPTVEDLGFALIRVRLSGGGRPCLQVMAERPDGTMTVDDCAELSRAISALLDVEDPIQGAYALEVSSPGIDRPLTRPRDFERFAGHEAKIELVRLLNGRRRFRGRLCGLDGQHAVVEDEAKVIHRLPLDLIEEAKLVLTDALIAESLKAGGQPAQASENGNDAPAPRRPVRKADDDAAVKNTGRGRRQV